MCQLPFFNRKTLGAIFAQLFLSLKDYLLCHSTFFHACRSQIPF
jgi:hypothetical protein